MYLDYFGLEKEPFTISPDPAFLYPSPQHRQALAHLKYGLDREGGFILLTGEVGTGKTTLTRLLLEQLPGNIRVAYILNTKLNSEDVLASICQDLSLSHDPGASIKTLTDLIYKDLLTTHGQGKKTLLVLEEGQNLDIDVLETLRLLSNLETNTTKLLHILLVGQPELQELLARNELRQLNQRVVSRFHIEPLDLPETTNYLNHRLRHAGCKQQVFDSTAIKQLHKLSGGIPRLLNLLAERSLLGAYATSLKMVSLPIVKAASQEVFGHSIKSPKGDRSALWMKVAVAVLLAACGILFFNQGDEIATTETSIASAPSIPSFPVANAPEPILTTVESTTPMTEAVVAPKQKAEPNPKVAPVSEPVVDVPIKNSYEQLLELWGVNAEVADQGNFCRIAKINGLECRFEKTLNVQEIAEINRPGLVTWSGDPGSLSVYMLSSFINSEIQLVNSSNSISVSTSMFRNRWNREFIYLWRPPYQYSGVLYPGSRSPQMVSWVQAQLSVAFDDYEYVIGGGTYSKPIVRAVERFQLQQSLTADGLIGSRTILRLMDQTATLPRLDQAVSLSETTETQAIGY